MEIICLIAWKISLFRGVMNVMNAPPAPLSAFPAASHANWCLRKSGREASLEKSSGAGEQTAAPPPSSSSSSSSLSAAAAMRLNQPLEWFCIKCKNHLALPRRFRGGRPKIAVKVPCPEGPRANSEQTPATSAQGGQVKGRGGVKLLTATFWRNKHFTESVCRRTVHAYY